MADPSGDAVLFEGDEVLWKLGHYQVGTNFYQSQWDLTTPPPCDRFRIATQMLEDAAEINVELIRKVLMATHQEGAGQTVYSNIYDLKNGLVYLYHFHNFENVVVIDLADELKQGVRILDIPSLFPETFAALSNVRKPEFECSRRKAVPSGLTRVSTFSSWRKDLANLAGTYSGEWLGDLQYQLMVADGDLYARFIHGGVEAMPLTQIYPVSRTECVLPGPRRDNRYVFEADEGGAVVGLEVKQPGGWGYALKKVV